MFSNVKTSICEHFNRTLEEKMWKQFSLHDSYKWINIIGDLVLSYDNTVHRTIKMKPVSVISTNAEEIYNNINKNKLNIKHKKNKFKTSDKVRISQFKHMFEKVYTPNYTTEIFTIDRVINTNPNFYLLKDFENKPIKGCFCLRELFKKI